MVFIKMNKYFVIILLTNLFVPDASAYSPFIDTQSAKEGEYSLVPSWISDIALTFFIIIAIGYLIKFIPDNIFKIFNFSIHNQNKKGYQNHFSDKQEKIINNQKNFVYDDKVFHSKYGFGYVTSTENEIIEVFFKDDLKKRKVTHDTLKRF